MFLHRSNRSEELLGVLTEVVLRPLRSPFLAETIVVQSKGMERWLSLELASRLGIWTAARFPFPRVFIDEILQSVLPLDGPSAARWERAQLFWSVAQVLHERMADPAFLSLCQYVGNSGDSARLVELSLRIADVFDQYAVFRPELVLGWELGQEDHWQAVLWRALTERLGPGHLAARAQTFFEQWNSRPDLPSALPERVSIFGISSLPPIYVRILAALSERIELHFFQFSPSRHYAGHVRTPKELSRDRQRVGEAGLGELHVELGNPLFSSMAREARDFQQLLLDLAEPIEDDRDLFKKPEHDSRLHVVQSDVLELCHRGEDAEVPRKFFSGDDHSILVHACHGPWREVEVLRDQLRALFDSDHTLKPEDVVVMTPELDRYAPLIDAAFDVDPDDPLYIPYRIADRSRKAMNPAARALSQLATLFQERVSASRVLDLLALPQLRQRFGIDEAEIPTLSSWVRESGIRWGIDAADRSADGQPEFEENTWRFGLRRLLLGHALPAQNRHLYAGVLPYDDLEGTESESLGKLAELCDVLFAARRRLKAQRPFCDWITDIQQLLSETLLFPEGELPHLQELIDVLNSLTAGAAAAQFVLPLDLDLVMRLVLDKMESERTSHNFLAGGLTICAMLPMRSIPFRVIALLGMNDGAFPRTRQPPSFDEMGAHPMLGDRSLRDEDRHLFLEAVLSARQRLIITFVGKSLKDDTALPPSVVVSELLDVLDESFLSTPPSPDRLADEETPARAVPRPSPTPQPAVKPSAQCTVVHPLQAFSMRYFDGADSRLVGFDPEAAAGARALAGEKRPIPPFLPQPLNAEPANAVVRLEDLGRCLENPARGLLRDRLGLFLDERPELIADREPLELAGLDRYTVGSDLLARAVEGERIEESWPVLVAKGVLPLGTPGRRAFASIVPEVHRIMELGASYAQGTVAPALDFDHTIGQTRLVGKLSGLWREARLERIYARVRAKTEISVWITHLALQMVAPAEYPRVSVLVGRAERSADPPKIVRFNPLSPARARELLEELVSLYWLARRTYLPFFPQTSRCYVEALRKFDTETDREERALDNAREAYSPPEQSYARGDLEDPYVYKLYADSNPLETSFRPYSGLQPDIEQFPDFARVALQIYTPLLEVRDEGQEHTP